MVNLNIFVERALKEKDEARVSAGLDEAAGARRWTDRELAERHHRRP